MINTKNIRLFPFYKAFSYDVLFYYATSILYLTTVKNLSISEVALLASIFSLFQMSLQLPLTFVVNKIGMKKSIVLANISCCCWAIIYLFTKSFSLFLLAELFFAIGFALKGLSESPFIFSTMKHVGLKGKVSKVEGKGSALYFTFEAIASVISGFLFILNPYIPLSLALVCFMVATIIASNFIDDKKSKDSNPSNSFSDLKNGLKFIMKSSRLKAVMLFSCVFFGLYAVSGVFSKSYFNELQLDARYFGIIYCIFSVLAAIGAAIQDKLEQKTKKKTLTYISYTTITTFIILGLCTLINFNSNFLTIFGIIIISMQAFIKGSYRIIIKKYLNNFSSSSIRTKIMAIYYLLENLGSAICLFIASKILGFASIGISYIIMGLAFFVILTYVLSYMKTRIGLDPDKYKEKDIKYTDYI